MIGDGALGDGAEAGLEEYLVAGFVYDLLGHVEIADARLGFLLIYRRLFAHLYRADQARFLGTDLRSVRGYLGGCPVQGTECGGGACLRRYIEGVQAER